MLALASSSCKHTWNVERFPRGCEFSWSCLLRRGILAIEAVSSATSQIPSRASAFHFRWRSSRSNKSRLCSMEAGTFSKCFEGCWARLSLEWSFSLVLGRERWLMYNQPFTVETNVNSFRVNSSPSKTKSFDLGTGTTDSSPCGLSTT